MDDTVSEYSQAIAGLKVHKRVAGNIKEQLSAIFGNASDFAHRLHVLMNTISAKIPELQQLSNLSPLKAYLSQGETSRILDSLFDACWTYALECHDELIREDILALRQIYESDRKADGVSLRRLLRDCLRGNVDRLLTELNESEVSTLREVVKMEVKAVEQTPDAARLYQQFLSRWADTVQCEEETSRNSGHVSKILQDLTEKVVRVSDEAFSWGAVCSFHSAEMYGKRVALATPKPSKTYKKRMDAIAAGQVKIQWKDFHHSNVLPLLGIVKNFQDGVALVTPWMSNDAVDYYLRRYPRADRVKLITDIASGLNYLHSQNPPYVHGIINLGSILVDSDGNAVIGGFASSVFEPGISTSLRYLAPELIKDNDVRPYLASDVYSFARVALYIITEHKPYTGIHSSGDIIRAVLYNKQPDQPSQNLFAQRGIDDSDKLWSIISQCWADDPISRPSMAQVLRVLEEMKPGQGLLVDVKDLTRMISFPEGESICARGSFGDVRTGILLDFGKVALKTINVRGAGKGNLRATKRFLREASIWNSLRHPNILPFLGIADPPGLSTCLVSPWVSNGNLVDYLRSASPGSLSDDTGLYIARGIANGLEYLHSQKPPVIHGDLRGVNILISSDGSPLLCDFGLAVIVEDLTRLPLSSTLQNSGNPRWMAPELFIGEGTLVSVSSDVYALGMVLLEMVTLDIPYSELRSSTHVILEVYRGETPRRPPAFTTTSESSSPTSSSTTASDEGIKTPTASQPQNDPSLSQHRGQPQDQNQSPSTDSSGVLASPLKLTDDLWALMLRCWSREPLQRPSAGEVSAILGRMGTGAAERGCDDIVMEVEA